LIKYLDKNEKPKEKFTSKENDKIISENAKNDLQVILLLIK